VGDVPVYAAARGRAVRLVLPSRSAIGVPLTLLVRRRGAQRVETYLPVRPNRGTGWVSRRAVRLLTTAYGLQVHLRTHRLFVLVSGRVVHTFTIGVGRSVTPTPSGTYFITELLKQPDPAGPYGPYAFGLSAHSGVLQHFGQGGDGQIGIHGTDEPNLIGADVSHGCIRLRNRDVLWLVHRLPLGTPVAITRT
jgi:lipoprotein-anchoring transpeptidase ErfK/SrfK